MEDLVWNVDSYLGLNIDFSLLLPLLLYHKLLPK